MGEVGDRRPLALPLRMIGEAEMFGKGSAQVSLKDVLGRA